MTYMYEQIVWYDKVLSESSVLKCNINGKLGFKVKDGRNVRPTAAAFIPHTTYLESLLSYLMS